MTYVIFLAKKKIIDSALIFPPFYIYLNGRKELRKKEIAVCTRSDFRYFSIFIINWLGSYIPSDPLHIYLNAWKEGSKQEIVVYDAIGMYV